MKILDELFRYTESLKRLPSVDLTRMCLLVDKSEWDDLASSMWVLKPLTSWPPKERQQCTHMKVNGVEVRRR